MSILVPAVTDVIPAVNVFQVVRKRLPIFLPSILRQNGTSYRIFALLSMVAQYIHVLPAERIDNKMKGWTDRTKRLTHRESDKQTDILYDHRTI